MNKKIQTWLKKMEKANALMEKAVVLSEKADNIYTEIRDEMTAELESPAD